MHKTAVIPETGIVKHCPRNCCNPYANRKITKFPKKQILAHGVVKALKQGFTVILINPRGTSNSLAHKQVMREKGLDSHMASAYIIAYRGFKSN